ncbi:Paraquat-inducible protein A [Salmonella bongori]|nr:Paraquat-inducible protein A [Salmonella bongori]
MLLLMPFAWSEPLLHIYLLGVRIDANVMQGIWQMTQQGDPLTAAMVFFCVVGAPLILVFSIAYLWFGSILGMNLRPVLLMLEKLKDVGDAGYLSCRYWRGPLSKFRIMPFCSRASGFWRSSRWWFSAF